MNHFIDFEYDSICKQSYPCQHTIRFNGKEETWGAVKIYRFYIKNNMNVPAHFKYIERYLMKQLERDYPNYKIFKIKK